MIDLQGYGAYRMGTPTAPKTKEQLQRECRWCAHQEGNACQCFEDCKRAHCPMSFEEFVSPPVPTFRREP